MRRTVAVVLGTITGTSLLIGAKLGAESSDRVVAADPGSVHNVVVERDPAPTPPPSPSARPAPSTTPGRSAKPSTKPSATPTVTPTKAPSPTSTSGTYADGVYSASAEVRNGRFGTLSMTVTISGGRISTISASQTDGTGSQCYHGSCPALRAEVLTAQSAKVNVVSRATYTSDTYIAELAGILDGA
jgi:uncharacterized protein with FMN-binding domain